MSEQTSRKSNLPFEPITIDFVNHVIYHVAISMREREIDPRTSVLVSELWTYRLQMMGEIVETLGKVSEVAFGAIDAIGFARDNLNRIKAEIEATTDKDALRKLIIEAHVEIERLEELMEELPNVN